MRNNLIKLLRSIEHEDGFQNFYPEYFEQYQCVYDITEYVEFPSYKSIVQKYNEKYLTVRTKGKIHTVPSSSIRAELKRMEADGPVMIGVQEGTKNAHCSTSQGPDFEDNNKFSCESVVLTTKGKSGWQYFLYKATENPVTTIISIVALIISIIALFI